MGFGVARFKNVPEVIFHEPISILSLRHSLVVCPSFFAIFLFLQLLSAVRYVENLEFHSK